MDSQFDRERGATPARSHAELPLPVVPLPRPNTNPRPWDVEVEVRQFYKTTDPVGNLVLALGSEADKIRVTVGTVNDVIPTLSTVALDDDPYPEVTITTQTWFWLRCETTYGATDTHDVTVETNTAGPAKPSGTDITAGGFVDYHYIGSADVDAGVASILENRSPGDLKVDAFGSLIAWWLV